MAGRGDIEAGRSFVRLFLKNDLSKALAGALKAGQEKLKAFGDSVTSIGQKLAGVGTAIGLPVAMAVKRFADFDDTMRSVAGVSQATQEELAALTAKAKELGAATSFTAVEVGSLMVELGRAGFTAQQIDKMTESVLNMSRATGTDATLSAGIMAATIRQFALGAEDAARVADVLTAGANKTFNSVESLGEAMSYAGPVALDFGMSLEDTVAILGQLGNVGIQGSNAGTALRRMLTITGAEAEKLKGIFGVDFVDAAGNARPLIDTLGEVEEATKGLGTAARSAKFNEAFGLLGITAASALGKTSVNARELRDELLNVRGAAKKTADMMDSGLGGTIRITLSAIEGLAIQIGEVLAPSLTKVGNLIIGASNAAMTWVKANKEITVAAVAAVAGLIGLGGALIGIGTAAKMAAFVMGGLSMVVSVLGSPIGLAVAALVAGAVAWTRWTESGQAALQWLVSAVLPMVETIKQTFAGIVTAIQNGNWSDALAIAFAGLKIVAAQGLDALKGLIGESLGNIVGLLGSGDFAGAWGQSVNGLALIWETFSKGIVDTFASAAEGIVRMWMDAVGKITDALFDLAAIDGPIGDLMSKVLGVDLRQVKQQWDAANRELGISDGDVFANAKGAARQGIAASASGTLGSIAAARDAAAARQADAAGRFSSGNMQASKGLSEAAKSAQAELDALLAKQRAAGLAPTAMAATTSAPGAGGGGPAAIPGLSLPQSSVGLGPTFSAAAAQAAGQTGSSGGPQEKALGYFQQMTKDLRELGLLAADQTASLKETQALYTRFLAAFTHG